MQSQHKLFMIMPSYRFIFYWENSNSRTRYLFENVKIEINLETVAIIAFVLSN